MLNRWLQNFKFWVYITNTPIGWGGYLLLTNKINSLSTSIVALGVPNSKNLIFGTPNIKKHVLRNVLLIF